MGCRKSQGKGVVRGESAEVTIGLKGGATRRQKFIPPPERTLDFGPAVVPVAATGSVRVDGGFSLSLRRFSM